MADQMILQMITMKIHQLNKIEKYFRKEIMQLFIVYLLKSYCSYMIIVFFY